MVSRLFVFVLVSLLLISQPVFASEPAMCEDFLEDARLNVPSPPQLSLLRITQFEYDKALVDWSFELYDVSLEVLEQRLVQRKLRWGEFGACSLHLLSYQLHGYGYSNAMGSAVAPSDRIRLEMLAARLSRFESLVLRDAFVLEDRVRSQETLSSFKMTFAQLNLNRAKYGG